jgi:hypothetical protein
MYFENQLLLNHEPSLDYIAQAWATECVKDDDYTSDWDHEYERAWSTLEDNLLDEGLKITPEGGEPA